MSKTLVYPHTTSGFQRHAFTSIASCMQKKRLRIRTTKLCVLSCKSKDTIHGHLHFGLKKASRYVTHSRSFDEIGLSRPPLKDSEGSTSKIPQSSKGNRRTPSQEELLSLFRRIQASIAEGESSRAKKIKPKPKDEKPTAESILEILHNSQKQERDNNAVEGRNESKKTIGSLPKEKREVEDSSLPTSNFKLTRPPSNFIKRSAIPALSTPRGLDHLVNSGTQEMAIPDGNEMEFEKLNKMKLSELKEIAKSQGRKGYSKLKKKELVEFLMS